MSLNSYTCTKGHKFPAAPDDGRTICPVCGEVGDVIFHEENLVYTLQATNFGAAADSAVDFVTVNAPQANTVMVGEQATRNFTLLQLHGIGGNGVVSLAEDQVLQRSVAIKQIRADQDNPRVRQRFLKEAKITGQLEHPGIVPIYSLECDSAGKPFLVMRFIQGRTLREAIEAYHRQPSATGLGELLRRYESVCQTIAYAHSKGVVHRDLKPTNIMIGDFGETLVLDWGLAKKLDGSQSGAPESEPEDGAATSDSPLEGITVNGHVLGTPGYLSPEQARGAPSDKRADVFGLGAILCHILTGKQAVVGRTARAIVQQTAAGDLSETRQRLEACGADADLVELAWSCLQPERAQRLAHAGLVAERLTAYLASVQEKLRAAELARAEAVARAGEEAKRRKLALGLAAALMLLLGGAALGWFWMERAENDRRREAEALLHNVKNLVQTGHLEDAETACQRGLLMARSLWAGAELSAALDERLRLVQRERRAEQLNQLANLLRIHAIRDFVPQRGLHVLTAGCRHVWKERGLLAQPGVHLKLEQHKERRIQEDLLDLAILWGDLQVRLARPDRQQDSRRAALELLAEAEALFGASTVVASEQLSHARHLDLPALVTEVTTRMKSQAPTTAWEYCGLGRTRLRDGDLIRASRFFERALELQPLDFAAHFLSGVCSYRRGRHTEALSAFSVCIGQKPEVECYVQRGLAAAALGQNDAALRDFDYALKKEPTLGPAYLQRGLVHALEQRWAAAASDLEIALKHEANPAITHYHLARIHVAQNDPERARTHVQNALQVRPEYQEAQELKKRLALEPK